MKAHRKTDNLYVAELWCGRQVKESNGMTNCLKLILLN